MELQLTRVAAPITEKKVDKILSAVSQPNDLSKVIADSTKALASEPTKRKRRTRAEIEADNNRVASSGTMSQSAPQVHNNGMPVFNPPPIDRTKELAPAFKLYSEIFLAKPIGCPELSLSDDESEALAKVTSNLMNAFPEYFNTNDPRMSALLGLVMVAGPIGYSKYKIYRLFEASKIKQDVKPTF